jgi:hypothetical protein
MVKVRTVPEEAWDVYPDGFLEALGRLEVEYGRAEYLLKLVYKQLHGRSFSEGMELAEGHRQFTTLSEETKKTAQKRLTDPRQRDKLCDVIDELQEQARDRNDMIHAMWHATDDGKMQRTRIERDKKTSKLDWSKSIVLETRHVKVLAGRLRITWEWLHQLRQSWPDLRNAG